MSTKFLTNEVDLIVWKKEDETDRYPWNWYHKGSYYNCYTSLEEALKINPKAKVDAVSWGKYLAEMGKLISGKLV